MSRVPSVVLLSGGLDSAANLALCADRDLVALALTCRYGQRAQDREVAAARAFCEFYGVEHRVLELPWIGGLGSNALTDASRELPRPLPGRLDHAEDARRTAKAVWVPNRNGILINAAAAFAESIGARRVVVGFNREEAATFPDNSAEFLSRATRALELSTSSSVEAYSYTAEMDKRGIVSALSGLGRSFPFGLVWSCYGPGPGPCGVCESCQRLDRALGAVRS